MVNTYLMFKIGKDEKDQVQIDLKKPDISENIVIFTIYGEKILLEIA